MPNKIADHKTTISLTLERSMLAELKRLSKMERRPYSWMVRECIRYALPRLGWVIEQRGEFTKNLATLAEVVGGTESELLEGKSLAYQLDMFETLEEEVDRRNSARI